ncbi:hypothetical protein J3Q64DRAFT_1699632 [Phycomyces blakesleeanus]|uniref:Uncharacterized protein n=1 Tax=Phycomyces blakesleeanus TaxID=4837 RepID=A0ABR3AWI6_PHYBL
MSIQAQADDIDGRGYRSTHSKQNPQGPTKSPPPVLMPCPVPATAPTRPLVQLRQASSSSASLQTTDAKNTHKQSLAAKYANKSHSTAFQPFHPPQIPTTKILSPISRSPHDNNRPAQPKSGANGPLPTTKRSPETLEPAPIPIPVPVPIESQKDSRQIHITPPESTHPQDNYAQDGGYTRASIISPDIHQAVMRQNELLRQQLELLKLENHKFKDRQVVLEQHIMTNHTWQRHPQDQWRTSGVTGSGGRGPQVRRSSVSRSRSWGPEDPRSHVVNHETPIAPRYIPVATQQQGEEDVEHEEREEEEEDRPDRRGNSSGGSTGRRGLNKGKARRGPTASLSDSIAQSHRVVSQDPIMSPSENQRSTSRNHRSRSQPRILDHPSTGNYILDDGWYQPDIRHGRWHDYNQDYTVIDSRGEYVTYGDDQYYSGDEEDYYYTACEPIPRKSSGHWSTRQHQQMPVRTESLRRVRSSQSTNLPRERHSRQPVYQQREVFAGAIPRQTYRGEPGYMSPAAMSPGVNGTYTEYRSRPGYPTQYIQRVSSRGRPVYPADLEPVRSYSSYGPMT